MKWSRKPELKQKVVAKAYMLQINVAFGYEKKIWPEEPAQKNYLAPIWSEKNILTQTKHPSPRPLNIKWTVPYAIPSRGNSRNDYRNVTSFRRSPIFAGRIF